jgi:hypothetical protein
MTRETTGYWRDVEVRSVQPVEIEAMRAAEPVPDFTDPGEVLITFLAALEDREQHREALCVLVTPESLEDWGDFSAEAAALEALGDWGVSSKPLRAVDDPDVAYGKVLSGVRESFQLVDDGVLSVALIVTLTWRPECDRWLIHAVGKNYIAPMDVPR